MKNLMKWSKLLIIAIISFFGISSVVNAATNAPSTIKVGSRDSLTNYIGDVYVDYKKSTAGDYIYCVERGKDGPKVGTTLSKNSIMDTGIAYLLSNGYPTKKFTGNNYKDYYITQLAIWWYIDIVNGTKTPSLAKFEDGAFASNSLYSYVVSLKNGAVNAAKNGYANPNISINIGNTKMSLDSTGKYYVSDKISINATSISGDYSVLLTSAPTGTFIQNASGTKTNTFAQSSSFIIKVPVSAINALSTSIKFNVTATGSVNKAQSYYAGNSTIQKMAIARLYPETTKVNASKDLTLSTDKVIITKTNSSTGKNIAGAKLAIKNSSGTVVKSWTSTTSAESFMNLPAGKYTLYEVEAPKGYEKTTKVVEFSITNKGENIKLSLANSEIKMDKVIINKVDSVTGKNIAGAKLAIKNVVTGKVVKEFTSTLKAIQINDLPNGDYVLYEVEAPKGYEKSNQKTKFSIVNKNKTINLTFKNVELVKTSQVQISKLDITTGKELPGAKLTIKDSKGKVIDSWISTEESHYLTLEVGKYTLTEETSPEGYQLNTEVITFEVDGKENVIKVVMNNTPIPEEVVEVPKTGVNSIILYTITAIITAVGLGLVYKYGKANK